jgi:hypothetical protein
MNLQENYRRLFKGRLSSNDKMLISEANEVYLFSGYKRFMDQKAVNVFKKYGIDKSALNRKYDPNEDIVEFRIDSIDSNTLQKIADELERVDRGTGEYGGYIEEGRISSNDKMVISEANSAMRLKSDIDRTWKTADEVAGDMQQWLSGIASTDEDMYNKVMDILANLADNFEPYNEM